MPFSRMSAWLSGWFNPAGADALNLRHGQLMHVMPTGRSALVSSLATIAAVAGIAATWHDTASIVAFIVVSSALSVIAQIFYVRAEAHSARIADYRVCNAYFMAHSLFTVAAMAVVGMLWTPGAFASNLFVMLVLVVCATVRASHQAAHLPSAALSAIYFVVGIGLLLWEGTGLDLSMVVLGLSVAAMLADLTWRMHRTVEAMLKLSQSERALLNDQRRLLDELRVANEAKSQFMARMSHELRTPLNAVIGFSDVMLHETMGPVGTPVYVDYLKHINGSGAHLLQLINDILDLSKIEAGRFELREGSVEPHDAVEDALAMVRLRAEEGGIALMNEVPGGITLRADSLALRQIVINLVSNAVKFTPPGGSVRCSGGVLSDGSFQMRVEDTGHGIPAEDMDWVFKPFGQSESGYHARERGTGLGLPIVRSLMELHGGTAALASTVGKGTAVTITFPARRLEAAAGRVAA